MSDRITTRAGTFAGNDRDVWIAVYSAAFVSLMEKEENALTEVNTIADQAAKLADIAVHTDAYW